MNTISLKSRNKITETDFDCWTGSKIKYKLQHHQPAVGVRPFLQALLDLTIVFNTADRGEITGGTGKDGWTFWSSTWMIIIITSHGEHWETLRKTIKKVLSWTQNSYACMFTSQSQKHTLLIYNTLAQLPDPPSHFCPQEITPHHPIPPPSDLLCCVCLKYVLQCAEV